LYLLTRIKPAWTAAFCGLHGLTVDNPSRWPALASRRTPCALYQETIDPLPNLGVAPIVKIMLNRRERRKIFRQSAPLAAGRKHIENRVHNDANIPLAWTSNMTPLRQQWSQRHPLFRCRVACIAQPITPILLTGGFGPSHVVPPRRIANTRESQQGQNHLLSFRSASKVAIMRRGRGMNRRAFLTSAALIATVARYASAQTPTKVFTIGWLTAQRALSLTPFLEVFRSGLGEFGYRIGDNLKIEYRYGDDNLLRVAPLAAELTRQGVNLLVVQGAAVPLVYELKLPIPSVYVFSGDPVVAGIAESLARPGGNMTGLTFMAPELNAKRLELLRDIVPSLRR